MDILGHIKEILITPCYRRDPLEIFWYSYAKWRFALHRVYTPEEFLSGMGISPRRALKGYSRWREMLEGVVARVREKQGHQGGVSVEDGIVLFGIISALQPEYLVETGVAAGVSNSFINAALIENGHGILYSIELPPDKSAAGRHEDGGVFAWPTSGVGWAVPPQIRAAIGTRNVLVLEDVRTALPRLLNSIPQVDLFFHDDLHTPAHMLWEYELIWPHLRKKGILVSDDSNFAWIRFCHDRLVKDGRFRNMQRLTAAWKP